jgi:hypothetical protein
VYRKPQPDSLPYQRNFHVRLAHGHLLISTTRLMVAVHHFSKVRANPDYTMHFMVSENPELASLFDPLHGWDFIGLVAFLWRQIDVLNHLDLRDPAVRQELGLRTVSVPSQKPQRQEKRSAEQAMQLIRAFVLEHPNCTRLEIARGINRKKSPHLLAQIEWLVRSGVLARMTNIRPEGTIEYRYIFVSDNDVTE